jgi:hypothetical protein
MTSVTPKTLGLGLAALLAVLVLTSLLTGEAEFVLPVVLLAAVIALAVAAGASTEVHEELGEHDLPPDSAARSRAERTR